MYGIKTSYFKGSTISFFLDTFQISKSQRKKTLYGETLFNNVISSPIIVIQQVTNPWLDESTALFVPC